MKTTLTALLFVTSTFATSVRLERVPENGVQPEVATTADGAVHLIYLNGDPKASDVRYVRKATAAREWSTPITVNSDPGSAIAMGTIRGAKMAIGKDNTIHVVWNGAMREAADGKHRSGLFYTRLASGGAAFEAQKDLLGNTLALDGGASIAADAKGGVFVIWHGARPGTVGDERKRVVFVAKSTDNGATFAPTTVANADATGTCACCSLTAFMSPAGELFTLYRSAKQVTQRDITLLSSRDGGTTFTQLMLHPWATGMCPMSSASITMSGKTTLAAWETEGRIFAAPLPGGTYNTAQPVSGTNAKHPAMASNARGETVVAWSVGTGWQRGGGLAWAVLDSSGKPTKQHGEAPGVPVWSHTAAYATPDNDFVILH